MKPPWAFADAEAMHADPSRPRALVVEDDHVQAMLVQALLERGLPSLDVDRVEFLAEALDRIATVGYDVVVLDLWLPDATGFDALEAVHAASGVPVVLRANGIAGALPAVARERGATEVVPKTAPAEELVEAVVRALARAGAAR